MSAKRFLLLILAYLFLNKLCAQLCQGSLGDPVVNITFGSGENFGAPLGAAVNNYTFVSSYCPDDGYYSIANSTSNCFGNTWLNVSQDHTPGDNNGYMMVVNASFEPGDFYVQTVDGLCGGTTYEFAAWILNLLGPTACPAIERKKPNITFNIETTSGAILQTYTTGDIEDNNSTVWWQYGLFFTTPANTSSVVIRMTNNAEGGCGNDLALDDITFRPCGPKVTININGVSNTVDVCTGDTSGFNFTSTIVGGYSNTFYQWQQSMDSVIWTDLPSGNNQVYSIPPIVTPGKYFYRLAVAAGSNISLSACRIASEPVTINVHSLPVPLASNSGPSCEDSSVTLMASGGGTYSWLGPNNFLRNTQSPVITNALISDNGMYYVEVTSEYGCITNDSTALVVDVNPSADAGKDVQICEGTLTTLQGSGINAISYSWSPYNGLSNSSIPAPSASPTETTSYILTVKNGACKASDSVLVTVSKKPVADAGPDKAFLRGQLATLDGQAGGTNISYFWTPSLYLSSDAILNPQASPPYDTTYTLNVISNDGCGIATDKVFVRYFNDVYIPNAFTPNNDGVNDFWKIPILSAFPLAEVSVYNRYGQLIFFNKGYTRQWDGTYKGTAQSSGVYCYVVDLKNGLKKFTGIVVIIR